LLKGTCKQKFSSNWVPGCGWWRSSLISGDADGGTSRGSGGEGSRAHQGLISGVGWVGFVAGEGARRRQEAVTAGMGCSDEKATRPGQHASAGAHGGHRKEVRSIGWLREREGKGARLGSSNGGRGRADTREEGARQGFYSRAHRGEDGSCASRQQQFAYGHNMKDRMATREGGVNRSR
jgi:hypothetical protein